jgi:antitoxin VapB
MLVKAWSLSVSGMVDTIGMYQGGFMKGTRARVFWTGRSQAIRLPKEFRVATDTVLVRREGSAIVIEPADGWPEGYIESFAGIPDDFERPAQGEPERREKLE